MSRTLTIPRALHPRRLAWTALVLLTLVVAIWFILVPARSLWALSSEVDDRRAELERLTADTAELEQRIVDLGTDQEIERIARSEYNLVFPNEEAYAVLPPPPVEDEPEPAE